MEYSGSRRTAVLIVNSTLHIGGAEQVAACLAAGFNSDRFDVAACYLKEPGKVADQMVEAGVELLRLPGFEAGRQDYLSSLKLRRLIRSRRVEVIHTHDIHGLIDGAVCRLTMPSLRFVHTFHFGNYPFISARYRLIERSLWRVPDAVVAVGHAQAAAIRDAYDIPVERLRVIWNGVDDPAGRTCTAPLHTFSPPGVPVIASVSTLIPQKGLGFLLRAAALLRDSGERFVLLLAGDGNLREPLQAEARRLGLGEVIQFLGWVPQASDRVLPACDIFVQSSLWEAMSVVVLEAMAAGKPTVVTAVGENPHVVLDGQTGLTVPPGNPQALAEGLRGLLRDVTLRQRFGIAARHRYESMFTTQHMIDAYSRLYCELTGGPTVRPRANYAHFL